MNKINKFLSKPKNKIILISAICGIIILIICGIAYKNYLDEKEYKELMRQVDQYYRYYNDSNYDDNSNYFNQLTITKKSIKNGQINDTVYATITNDSNVTLYGSLKAIIYNNNEIVESAVLYLPLSGLEPSETVVIDGICNTVNGKYDKIEIYESYLYKK